ncbi:MAG: peptide chain release factor N(5)-glutamine methyltransferase [Neisseria sp.]|uniref:peptide chain release factor N(5)-glutamine methyltransferase n=1 Tax=Neisseria sp. TaxID=192066 RepID=UPI0026DBF3E9|nr:peptide chain release factor N(5)-glutamine methyltransferase [Neisseria sp.]MDO4641723.1 peptide chain release factor N(5)-glutamine methyltransferase [Neisseria sp.]
MTLKDFLRQTALPKHEARMLAQAVTGYSRAQLITRDNESLSETQLAELQSQTARRAAGEPLAYILGWREFYGRRFSVTPATLIPRPETEHLVDAVLARLPQGGKVWDLGCGSGAIAVTVALERPDAAVYASDISAAALAVAQNNARALGAAVGFSCGSWFEADSLSEKHSYDIIVSNPPYIEAGDAHLAEGDLRFEPQTALTDFADGLTCIRTLAAGAADRLKPQSWLLVEHGFNQGAAARAIFQQAGFLQVHTLPDLAGLDRITLGRTP